jgi:hypothetical protein
MLNASYLQINTMPIRKETAMVELHDISTDFSLDTVALTVDDPNLSLASASAMAKEKARAINTNAMMLSYHSGKTGEFWPTYDCGGGGRPPWIVFAEARGYNLKIDINDGDYEFFYVRF